MPTSPHDPRLSPAPRPGPFRAALILLMAFLGGCGGSLTAGGLAEVEVSLSGDAPDAPSSAPPPARAASTIGPVTLFDDHDDDDDDDDEPEGELELEFQLFLVRPNGTEVEVTDGELEVELDLAGDFEADAIRTTVPADTYSALRILFTEIEVEVDRGVIIDGVEIQGRIEVELEDDEVVEISRPVNLPLRDGARVEILLDMNASVWLRAIDPDLRVVAERVFADAISVVVR